MISSWTCFKILKQRWRERISSHVKSLNLGSGLGEFTIVFSLLLWMFETGKI